MIPGPGTVPPRRPCDAHLYVNGVCACGAELPTWTYEENTPMANLPPAPGRRSVPPWARSRSRRR